MAEIKKLTKRDYFSQLKEIVKDNVELVNFIDHEIELLNKKANSKTPSKTQIANESIKERIVKVLTEINRPATITDIQTNSNELAELSNQKISALLTQLVNAEVVVRIVDKKKAYFSVKSN